MREIFIEGGRLTDLAGWLGKPITQEVLSPGVTRFVFQSHGPAVATEDTGTRNWLSVMFPDGRWSDDVACAREASAAIRKPVYCDSGTTASSPAEFLVVDLKGERICHVDL